MGDRFHCVACVQEVMNATDFVAHKSEQAHQWSQAFANINVGRWNTPLIGGFKNGRGELYDRETYNGRTILVRFVWSDITAGSHHVEQSYSDDGGKTWEPNFVADLTRETK